MKVKVFKGGAIEALEKKVNDFSTTTGNVVLEITPLVYKDLLTFIVIYDTV